MTKSFGLIELYCAIKQVKETELTRWAWGESRGPLLLNHFAQETIDTNKRIQLISPIRIVSIYLFSPFNFFFSCQNHLFPLGASELLLLSTTRYFLETPKK